MSEDLRGWLEKADKMGELTRIEGADWDLEIGCITTLNWKSGNGPALLFDKIKGYPPGFRVLTGSTLVPSRVALTMGLPQGLSEKELLETLRGKIAQWEAGLADFAPKVVKQGPILENVRSGKDVDLLQFPVPKWHEQDGGRYIGTGDAVITRDPHTGVVNLGTYRIMVHDEKTTGLYTEPGRHGKTHYEDYHTIGQPCPVAVSIGHHPLIFRVACLSLPQGAEYPYIGAVMREPVEVVEEEVTGLPIPADSEIVIAGWCPMGKTRIEGPFGEFTGYYGSKERPAPIIEVERIYYRNNPIILGSPPGRSPNDTSYYNNLVFSLLIEAGLKQSGIPDVKGVWTHQIVADAFVTVSIKQRYAGHAKHAALIALRMASRTGATGGRYVIVVDEDIDVTNLRDVLWALCTRSNPEKDIDIIRNVRTSELDPILRKPAEALVASSAIIEACKPYEWIDDFPKVIEFDPELKATVREKWRNVISL